MVGSRFLYDLRCSAVLYRGNKYLVDSSFVLDFIEEAVICCFIRGFYFSFEFLPGCVLDQLGIFLYTLSCLFLCFRHSVFEALLSARFGNWFVCNLTSVGRNEFCLRLVHEVSWCGEPLYVFFLPSSDLNLGLRNAPGVGNNSPRTSTLLSC